MHKALVVLTTCPNVETADSIASALVRANVAACVNLIPGMTSIYVWKDELCRESEVQLVIKTTEDYVNKAFDLVRQLHPYELPEWLVLDASGSGSAYTNWMRSNLK